MSGEYRAILRGMARTDDAAFAEYLDDLLFPAHLREMSLFADYHDKALLLAPRGHAKTTLFNYRVARLIGLSQGRDRFGILTATSPDAEARSRAIRRLVEQPHFADVFPWARAGVEGTKWTDEAWTVKGAELGKDHTVVAMGLGGVRAGPRLNVLIADDVVGKQENETASQRQKALDTYFSVVDPMLVPDGRRMFLGTRWHEDDLYAHLIRLGWPHQVRQALTDGQPLWPGYWSKELLDEKRADLGRAIFDLQYMNDPSGTGGNIFKRGWFQYVDRLPVGTYPRRAGMDLAAGTKERSDYTAVTEWLEDAEHNLYFVGGYRDRLDQGHRAWLTGMTDGVFGLAPERIPDTTGPRLLWPTNALPAGFAGLQVHNDGARPLTRVNIEATVFQSTFAREVINKTRLPAVAVWPDKDKVTRARTLAARYEAGKVFHLRSATGLEDYEHELVAFPNGEHDDFVDAAVYGADLNAAATEFYFTAGQR